MYLVNAEPGWFQVVPGEPWNLNLKFCYSKIDPEFWVLLLKELYGISLVFPLFYTEGFFYIPGGEAFLPTVGSCEDVLNLMYLMSGILFCEPPKIRFSWLDPPFFFFSNGSSQGGFESDCRSMMAKHQHVNASTFMGFYLGEISGISVGEGLIFLILCFSLPGNPETPPFLSQCFAWFRPFLVHVVKVGWGRRESRDNTSAISDVVLFGGSSGGIKTWLRDTFQ